MPRDGTLPDVFVPDGSDGAGGNVPRGGIFLAKSSSSLFAGEPVSFLSFRKLIFTSSHPEFKRSSSMVHAHAILLHHEPSPALSFAMKSQTTRALDLQIFGREITMGPGVR